MFSAYKNVLQCPHVRARNRCWGFFFNYGVSTVLLCMNEWDCQINVIHLNLNEYDLVYNSIAMKSAGISAKYL